MFVIIGDKSKAVSNSSVNLCLTCSYYSSKRYSLNDRETKICRAGSIEGGGPEVLRGPVSQCTEYYDKDQIPMHEMKKMAWIIEASKRTVGFGELMDVEVIAPSKKKKETKWDEDL